MNLKFSGVPWSSTCKNAQSELAVWQRDLNTMSLTLVPLIPQKFISQSLVMIVPIYVLASASLLSSKASIKCQERNNLK
jgi:hypothetical protein